MLVIQRPTVEAIGERLEPATAEARHAERSAQALREAARVLNVNYAVSGVLRKRGEQLSVAVELIEARTSRIVWADEILCRGDDVLQVMQETGAQIMTADEVRRALVRIGHDVDAHQGFRQVTGPRISFRDSAGPQLPAG